MRRVLGVATVSRFRASLSALLLCLLGGLAFGQSGKSATLSEYTFRDAIFGRIELTERERQSLDLNADKLLDVADLVFFLKETGSVTPITSFESVSSVAVERSGTVTFSVVLTNPFDDVLHYTVSGGTATARSSQGADFTSSRV